MQSSRPVPAPPLDCPVCGAPVHVTVETDVAECPMCDAVGVPLTRMDLVADRFLLPR